MNFMDSCTSSLGGMSALCPTLQSGAKTLASWGTAVVTGISNAQCYLLTSLRNTPAAIILTDRTVTSPTLGKLALGALVVMVTPQAFPVIGMLYSMTRRTVKQNIQNYPFAKTCLESTKTQNPEKIRSALLEYHDHMLKQVDTQNQQLDNQKTSWMECGKYLLTPLPTIAILPQICAAIFTATTSAPAAIPVVLWMIANDMVCRAITNKVDNWHAKKIAKMNQDRVTLLQASIDTLEKAMKVKPAFVAYNLEPETLQSI